MMSHLHKLSCNIREHGLARLNAQQVAAMSAGQTLSATIMSLDSIPSLPADRLKQTDWPSFSRSELNLRQCEKSAATKWLLIPTLPSN